MAGIMKIKRSACRKLVVKRKENRPYGRTRRRWRIILKRTLRKRGGRVCTWLRCCATNRKAAGTIPDVVTGIFH